MIEGNVKAVIQVQEVTQDEYQVDQVQWKDAYTREGVLDLLDAGTNFKMMKRVEDSDHIFLCDYFLPEYEGKRLTAENSRFLIDGEIYEMKLFDDVMHRHEHLEIYLKYLGGQCDVNEHPYRDTSG